jgi:hypothetical protein
MTYLLNGIICGVLETFGMPSAPGRQEQDKLGEDTSIEPPKLEERRED